MKRLIFTLLLCAPGLSAPTWAGNGLPDHYPEAFTTWGRIEHIDLRAGTIVIADRPFRLSARLRVHTPGTRFGTAQTLREGMLAGVSVSPRDREQLLDTIWILPQGYTPGLKAEPLPAANR